MVQHTDERFLTAERLAPSLSHMLAQLATQIGVRELALRQDSSTGLLTANTAAELTYRDPVSLWIASTYAGASEPTEGVAEAWVAKFVLRCDEAEQCLGFVRRLMAGFEMDVDGESASITQVWNKPPLSAPPPPTDAISRIFRTLRSSL